MIKSHSNADEIILALSDVGLDITINDKCYSITLDPSESSTLGIMLMRQAHDVSKKQMEASASEKAT